MDHHIMADMPFMSYSTDDLGLENAKRLMQAGANSVKIEGDNGSLKWHKFYLIEEFLFVLIWD